jgi:hypothetical protein
MAIAVNAPATNTKAASTAVKVLFKVSPPSRPSYPVSAVTMTPA